MPMPFMVQPLTDAELNELEDFLCAVNPDAAMTVEELDGFFCALICGPELVPPSEYLPEVFGGELVIGRGVTNIEQAQELLNLLTRHWNTIAKTLYDGELYMPLLFEDENGIAMGNEWAFGFVQGMHMRLDSWEKLVVDKEHWMALTPMLLLAHEDDPDSEYGGRTITLENRLQLLHHMTASLPVVYDFFRERTLKRKGKKISKAKGGRKKPMVQ